MESSQQEIIRCSFCKKSVTVRQEFYIDENGHAIHADCYLKRILHANRPVRENAA
jgi:hypothetical protein